MKITKTKNVKTPSFGTDGSAGIDFFVPETFNSYTIQPQTDVNIPSGIKCEIPEGYALIAFNKSGVAFKRKLQVGACVVDSDYTGEIHIHMFNFGKTPIEVNPGDKLIQFILIPYVKATIEVVDNNSIFLNKETKRGTGGFGSTNTVVKSTTKPIKKDDSDQFEFLPNFSGVDNKYEETIKNIKLTGLTAYIVKINSECESMAGTGTYRRAFFRDITNSNNMFILDISSMCPQFINYGEGDTLTNLQIFENKRTKKMHINGRSKPQFIGRWSDVCNILTNKKSDLFS
jgi:dUTP pyrophosphatase